MKLQDARLRSTPAHEAGALGILKPLESDLRPISSLLATQAFNPNGHSLIYALESRPKLSEFLT